MSGFAHGNHGYRAKSEAPIATKKQVFTNAELPHIWAHQIQESGRNPNKTFYFEGPSIYSYGSHYVIARFVSMPDGSRAVLFNSKGYSPTTGQHMSAVRSAIPPDVPVWEVPTLPDNYYGAQEIERIYKAICETWSERIIAQMTETMNAKRADVKAKHYDSAVMELERLSAFVDAFKLDYKLPSLAGLQSSAQLAEYARGRQITQNRVDAARRAGDTRIAARVAQLSTDEQIEAWRNCQIGALGYNARMLQGKYAMLRVSKDGKALETSMGVNIPIDHAIRVSKLVLRLRKAGKTYKRNGHTIHLGHYQLDGLDVDGTLHAGCHHIQSVEFDAIVLKMAELPQWNGATEARLESSADDSVDGSEVQA